MKPMGWNDIGVASRAPTSEIRLLKSGIALAMIYAINAADAVQLSHTAQCVMEFEVRCLEPRRRRTKTYLAGIYILVNKCYPLT